MSRKTAQIITFTNQKGGVGKTTLTREIGIYLAKNEKKVLFVDLDSQGNLTKSLFGMASTPAETSLYETLENGFTKALSVFEENNNLQILTADSRLALLEKSLIGEMDGYTRLKDMLLGISPEAYDYILIDSPPSLGILSVNALAASTHFIIPMKPALYTLQGTNDLMSTVEKVKRNFNSALQLLGVIINEFDSIPVITREIKDEIESSFGEMLFDGRLSRSIKIEEVIARRVGLVHIADCKVKHELAIIGIEFIRRLENLTGETYAAG